MTAVKALDMSVSELGKWGEAYENHEGQEVWIAAGSPRQPTVNTYHTINYK